MTLMFNFSWKSRDSVSYDVTFSHAYKYIDRAFEWDTKCTDLL